MSIKIQEGTAEGKNKCDNCRYFRKMAYQNGSSYLECAALGGQNNFPLKGPVAECNSYINKGTEDLWSLKEKAWLIEISKSRKIGFVSPIERNKKQSDEMDNLEG